MDQQQNSIINSFHLFISNHLTIEARMDLVVGLTACSAEMSNNYSFKPIGYTVKDIE